MANTATYKKTGAEDFSFTRLYLSLDDNETVITLGIAASRDFRTALNELAGRLGVSANQVVRYAMRRLLIDIIAGEFGMTAGRIQLKYMEDEIRHIKLARALLREMDGNGMVKERIGQLDSILDDVNV